MRVHYRLKETIVTLGADKEEYIEIARAAIRKQRSLLEGYISSDPFFRITLEPYNVPDSAPDIVRRMAGACSTVGIGPMGAVAGTIAWMAVEAMVEAGATYAFVDNGGDIALFTDRPLLIGIFAGNSSIKDLGLEIQPGDTVQGICTSSGTVGPSISFGTADAALVVSGNVSLADAAATALGNAVPDEGELEEAFDVIRGVQAIQGAIVIRNDGFAIWGELPRLARARMKQDFITRG
ncbi:MAG: UPF0280 family protein [ANME-2 cluster archaeon]|nr:UPF0280 family protein [ANME-2 cluster archaeon]MBC2702072.1 UPF0280 family protein [ANME-2 cluster archaeon]MBC2708842.1 UPF0280 family protein [ANME-2 cluster archaeon]MBC2748203.1 UPF0280 family protein [ANME-2 cluster archaeon]MBC2763079.1 UPF0280 family protein [ANME-2 cluster archaeon]